MRAILTALAIWCAGLGAAAQFGKIAVIFDDFVVEYGAAGPVALGLLVSVVGIVGLVFGTTAGMVVARVGAKRAMLVALVLGAVISLLQSRLLPFGWMIASRIPEGFSHLAIVVVGPTAMAATASLRFQGLVMTLWSSFFGLTFAVLALIAPALVVWGGLGGLFKAHAVWMLACAAALWWLMPADLPRPAGQPQRGILAEHLHSYASPRIAAPALGFVCYTITYVAVLTLLPGVMSLGWGHFVAVAMPLTSIAVSLTLGVWLLGRMSAVRLVQWGFALAVVAALGLAICWGQGAAETAFACLVAAALGIVQGASFASIPQLNASPTDRAAAAGTIAQLGNLGTTTGTPLLAVLLHQAGVPGLTLFLIGFSVLGIVLHQWQARRRIRAGISG